MEKAKNSVDYANFATSLNTDKEFYSANGYHDNKVYHQIIYIHGKARQRKKNWQIAREKRQKEKEQKEHLKKLYKHFKKTFK